MSPLHWVGLGVVGWRGCAVDEHPDDVTIAKSAADILAAREFGKIAIVMGTQSANELEKRMTKSVGGTNAQMRTTLRAFYELGLRVQGRPMPRPRITPPGERPSPCRAFFFPNRSLEET